MRNLILSSLALAALACAQGASTSLASPASAREELFAADRAMGAATPQLPMIDKLLAGFSTDVQVVGGGRIATGQAAARELFASNPANVTSTLEWAPVSGDVSADGTNGYTYGFATLRRADGTMIPMKYLAYWVRENGAWRIRAYKRAARAPGEVASRSFPAQLVAATGMDSLAAARELAAAESAFSADAGVRGTVAAFRSFGSAGATHLGGPGDIDFRHGLEEVVAGIASGGDSKNLTWGSDVAIVARSGDMGLSLGRITLHPDDGKPAPAPFPFFTVWRKEAAGWRYVAE
ncbi:MAG: hypothetical protein JWO05_3663 [Gemmatimonadetes bacterium]|nr:hypothetical protein [Gemmatimonadota bacterium]